jgi:hypothetical protein
MSFKRDYFVCVWITSPLS